MNREIQAVFSPYRISDIAAWELYLTTWEVECRKTDTVTVTDGAVRIGLPEEAIFTLVGVPTR